MAIPLKEIVKINQLIRSIQSGQFNENDIDLLLIKLRLYAREKKVFREIADFIAHADSRNKGVSCESMTGFSDAMRYFVEYVGPKQALDISKPFPVYIHRLFSSQAIMANEAELRNRFHVSRKSLLEKIKNNFKVDKRSRLCSLSANKNGREFFAALQYITGFIYSKPAFDISEFHLQLKELLVEQKIEFDNKAFAIQKDKITLALLCTLSGAEFVLPDGDSAKCKLSTENNYRILKGQRTKPTGEVTREPLQLGTLQISGEIQVMSDGKKLTVSYPLVTTNLIPHDHCDTSLFEILSDTNEFGYIQIEFVNLADDMALTRQFKLVRASMM